MTFEEFARLATLPRDEKDARELRRIAHHKLMGTATWDDHKREHELRRRMAERSFEERERQP